MSNDPYPLYDVPWLVREPNEHYMSAERHKIELFNQSVVDDYFIPEAKGYRPKMLATSPPPCTE